MVTSYMTAIVYKIYIHSDSFICENGPLHIIRVQMSEDKAVLTAQDITEKSGTL